MSTLTSISHGLEDAYYVNLSGKLERTDDGASITLCDQLPLIGTGGTPEEAMESSMRCLRAYFDELEKTGSLKQALEGGV